jgi:hypothetical protein
VKNTLSFKCQGKKLQELNVVQCRQLERHQSLNSIFNITGRFNKQIYDCKLR